MVPRRRRVEVLYLRSPCVLGGATPRTEPGLPRLVDVRHALVARTGVAIKQRLRCTRAPQVVPTCRRCRRCLTPTPVRAMWHLCWGAGAPQRPSDHGPTASPLAATHSTHWVLNHQDVPSCPRRLVCAEVSPRSDPGGTERLDRGKVMVSDHGTVAVLTSR